jgi:hypothetical protein
MLAAMPHAQAKPGKLAVPNTVFMEQRAQLAAGKIAVEKGPSSGLLPGGDHKAIFDSRTAGKKLVYLRVSGDQIAIVATRTVRQFCQPLH